MGGAGWRGWGWGVARNIGLADCFFFFFAVHNNCGFPQAVSENLLVKTWFSYKVQSLSLC